MTKSQKVNKTEEIVTNYILDGLKKGELVWTKTWNGATGILPINHKSKTAYNGLNCYLSWVAIEKGYDHNEWLTMNQIIEMKGLTKGKGRFGGLLDKNGERVKGVKLLKTRDDGKKQTACPVERWGRIYRRKEDWKFFTEANYKKAIEDGCDKDEFSMFWRLLGVYYVFNIQQTTLPLPKVRKAKKFRTTGAEKIVEEVYKGFKNPPQFKKVNTNDACYYPLRDIVQMPKAEQFKSKFNGTGGNYYASTCFHEFIHSTGHKDRLSREGVVNIDLFGKHKETYANEELIAEMGACMMMAYHNLDTKDTINNSQAYVKGWLSRLENNKELIPMAIKQSNRAVRHILDI